MTVLASLRQELKRILSQPYNMYLMISRLYTPFHKFKSLYVPEVVKRRELCLDGGY